MAELLNDACDPRVGAESVDTSSFAAEVPIEDRLQEPAVGDHSDGFIVTHPVEELVHGPGGAFCQLLQGLAGVAHWRGLGPDRFGQLLTMSLLDFGEEHPLPAPEIDLGE